jgi:glucosamine--fructose-6-phosphate aminotransferase (isomerizing)
MVSNIKEVSARGGMVVSVVMDGETRADTSSDHVLRIPCVRPEFAPIVSVVPLQLLAIWSPARAAAR